MPAPKKKPTKDKTTEPVKNTDSRLQISVAVPALSGLDPDVAAQLISEVKTNIFNSINDAELQKALDKWIKENHSDTKIVERDYHVLKSVITEYLDSYFLFGYNTAGERIIVQHANTARDRDAVMEFLKTIFIQQQQNNFLDIDGDDEDFDGKDL
jgi:hypothetical protein